MKNSHYFPHDYNASCDDKLIGVIIRHGGAGMGAYWHIIERLYMADGGIELDYAKIIHQMNYMDVNLEMVKSLVNDFKLFYIEGNTIRSLSVDRRIEKRKSLSEEGRKNANKRWGLNAIDNGVPMGTQCDPNAINKIKEKKIKEIKERKERKTIASQPPLEVSFQIEQNKESPINGQGLTKNKEAMISLEKDKNIQPVKSSNDLDGIGDVSLTPIQRVVNSYKEIKDVGMEDKAWDRANFGRYAKAAKSLIDCWGTWEIAAKYIILQGQEFDSNNLTWTLETVARHAWDNRGKINDKSKHNQVGEDSVLSTGGLRQTASSGKRPLSAKEILADSGIVDILGDEHEKWIE